MYDRDELQKSLMSVPMDPDWLNPLIHSFPDCLKTFVVNIQDCIWGQGCRWGQQTYALTWNEFVHEVDKYGCQMGWVSSSGEKTSDHTWRVCQVYTQNSKPDQIHTQNSKSDFFLPKTLNLMGGLGLTRNGMSCVKPWIWVCLNNSYTVPLQRISIYWSNLYLEGIILV